MNVSAFANNLKYFLDEIISLSLYIGVDWDGVIFVELVLYVQIKQWT